jgi:predicted component of type VI protein secretion system
MLYIALGGKEGAPTISLNKIFDFISPKAPAAETAEAAPGADASASGAGVGPAPASPAPEQEKPAPPEAQTPAGDAQPAEEKSEATGQTDTGEAPGDAAFASMEELTEFYRKEAERLTGIKH